MGDSNLGEAVTSDLRSAIDKVSSQENVKKLNLFYEEFNSIAFYEMYKNAMFLKVKRDITRILSQYHEIATELDNMTVGEKAILEGMFIKPGVPLIITKSGTIDQSDVENNDFTLRRLTGLTAAYVWNNVDQFEGVYARDPEALELRWTTTKWERKLYLSAVSGAELFQEFEYVPFICALKKYSLEMITENELLNIATKPHPVTGVPMAVWYRRNFKESEDYNKTFFKPQDVSNMNAFIYNLAPSSVQDYLKPLGSVQRPSVPVSSFGGSIFK